MNASRRIKDQMFKQEAFRRAELYKLQQLGSSRVHEFLSLPGAIKAHARGRAQIFVLTKDEGGRHTPFTTGYAPQFFFGATDVSGVIQVDGNALVMPGDQAEIAFELGKPVGLEQGVRFAIREGGKTVGAGLVTAVDA